MSRGTGIKRVTRKTANGPKMEDSGKPAEPPESLQKGLLQLLWSTRPWIRNSLLILAGVIVLVYTVVPESVRDAAMLSLFGMNQAPAKDSNDGENDTDNPHVRRLPNGHLVRIVGNVQQNDSNVADRVIRHAIEFDAWRFLDCYQGAYGVTKAAPPSGTVLVDFTIEDQLPRQVKLTGNTFDSEQLGNCTAAIVDGDTLNEVGGQGHGHVSYAFKYQTD
jgi:hypothetical protein